MTRRVFALIGAILLGGAQAAAQQPTFESVLEGARREGAVVVWVSSPGRQETHRALFEAFNRRFGLSLRTEWSPVSSVQTGTRVIAEAPRGRVSVDVIGAGGAEEIAVLMERNLLQPYPWEQVFGRELPQIGSVVNRAIADIRGRALPVLDAVYGLGWNPQMIREEELPQSFADLLDPRWRGKISVNAFFLIPLDSTSYLIGREATLAMARRMIENRPILERGTPAVSRAISVGQAPLGVTTFHAAERAASLNEPQRFRLFSDFIPVFPIHVYVPEHAPNPNAARLFAAWLATEGIAIANQHEPTPRIGDPGSRLDQLIAISAVTRN